MDIEFLEMTVLRTCLILGCCVCLESFGGSFKSLQNVDTLVISLHL